MKIGYARVSTSKQSVDSQVALLKSDGCEKIFEDIFTGYSSSRPSFDEMNRNLRREDTVVITTLDRLGRSNKFLLHLIEEWKERGINLKILSHNIDTTTLHGKFMFDIMAALAEQERNLIRERIMSGLKSARARGLLGGRPSSLDDKEKKRLLELYAEKNLSVKELCKMYNISRTTLYNYVTKGGKL